MKSPFAALLAAAFLALGLVSVSGATAVGWETYPEILARIQAPKFPDRSFPITNYGATADGSRDSTAAIRQAIEACHAAGGGRVEIPAGVFLTGAIHLKSNVNLRLAAGATLRFSTDPSAYLPIVRARWEGIECMNYSPLIYAYEQENIAVTGQGTLDGGASDENWWGWALKIPNVAPRAAPDIKRLNEYGDKNVPVEQRLFGAGHFLRPNFVVPYRCRNVLIEGVTILRSPMWEVNPVLCENVTVRGLKISTHGPNNDGCNPDSSRNVLIEDCVFDTGDDCIAIKSGRNDDGRRVNRTVENIVVRNCTMKDGHGGVSIGSEIAAGCRNVFIENCTMDSPALERVLRVKSNARRGGVVENIFLRNIEVGRVAEAILTVDFLYEEGANGPHQPVVRNVSFEQITSRSTPRIFFVTGFKGSVIDRIRIAHSTFNGVDASEFIQHAGRIELEDVNIEPAQKITSLNSRPAAVETLKP